MFWIGFLGFYIVMGLLGILMICSQKLFDKFTMVLLRCKRVVFAVVFTLFSFIFTLAYSVVAIVTENVVINGLLCAMFLVFSWFVVEKMYQLMTGEKGCDNKELKTLAKEDKNVCNLFALIGVVLSSGILCYEDRSSEYVILISIAISIWIGAYIPVSEIYNGTSLRKLIRKIAKEFKSEKVSVWVSAGLSAVAVTILVSKNELIQKLNILVDEIGLGIAVGSIVMVSILLILGFCKKEKSKESVKK